MQITSSTHARGVNGSGSDAGIDVALYQYDYPDTRWDKFDGFRRVRSFNAYDTLLVDAPVTFNYKDTPAFRRASDSLVNVRLYFNVIYTGSGARADMYDATATFFELSPL